MALDRLSQVTSSGISSTVNFRAQGITVSGVVTATSFVGDGSGLTGVVGSGSGVIVRDDGTLVGTAGTINFGSNLSVSAVSAGIVTVTGTDTNTTYTQAAVADGSNVNLRLTGSDSTTDDILLTAGTNITFSSVTAGGLTISASGGSGSIAGIDTTGTSTFTNLNVTGVSTFAGITTVTGPTLFVKQLNASGVVTASSFSGSASGLTGIPAGQLTGALPALDGSALTGVVGSGSGVIVRDSGTLVGTAGTIDFGDNLTVSAVVAGIVTVTAAASGGGSTAGINTLGTSTFNNLNVTGVSTVGVVTGATYFGDGSRVVDGRWTVAAPTSSAYTFSGVGFLVTTSNPVLYLTRGRVYEFVITSGGSHPFQIRASKGGSAYNDGVTSNGATSGTLVFEVPFNAPDTLYYQCTSHGDMGADIIVNSGVRSIPQNSQTSAYILAASDIGKHISITTGGVTINTGIFSAGDAVSIYNNSGSNQTITQGASVTLRQAGTSSTGNRTLAQYGVCTVLCVGSGTFVISGAGLS